MFYLYAASSKVFRLQGKVKIGCTTKPHQRLSTYNTGYPPGDDMEFLGLWETTATSREEMFDHEEDLHDHFFAQRMSRKEPDDSEWFHFGASKDPYAEVVDYVQTRPWAKPVQLLADLPPPKYLAKPFRKNRAFLRSPSQRNAVLDDLQAPVVASIAAFVADPLRKAGVVIAPCGSGKTRMACQGIRGVRKCIVCCPSQQIQQQWRSQLLDLQTFEEADIVMVGCSGTTDDDVIRAALRRPTFCVITTYMSSHLLGNEAVDIVVFDEVHHMAGVVPDNDAETKEKEKLLGRTRLLLKKMIAMEVKRLSLTFTPRNVTSDDAVVFSMDDVAVFGDTIAELQYRTLVLKGVLPDYRLWYLHDQGKKASGIEGKAACVLEAWNATTNAPCGFDADGARVHASRPILNHLVVFAASVSDARVLCVFFKKNVAPGTEVFHAEQGERLDKMISVFTAAPRAILVNCKVLNEGVDIPAADSVAIMYSKKAMGETTQMMLRAGRAYENKNLFHILLPVTDGDDVTGFENVLIALASFDSQIRDEIALRASSAACIGSAAVEAAGSTAPQCIMIEEFGADIDELRKCFRRSLNHQRDLREVCRAHGVESSIDYAKLRESHREFELPEAPPLQGKTWYDYLHRGVKMSLAELQREMTRCGIKSATHYVEVRKPEWPTLQHINDGYFGEKTNFSALLLNPVARR